MSGRGRSLASGGLIDAGDQERGWAWRVYPDCSGRQAEGKVSGRRHRRICEAAEAVREVRGRRGAGRKGAGDDERGGGGAGARARGRAAAGGAEAGRPCRCAGAGRRALVERGARRAAGQARHLRPQPRRLRDRRLHRPVAGRIGARPAEAELRQDDVAAPADAASAGGADLSGGED